MKKIDTKMLVLAGVMVVTLLLFASMTWGEGKPFSSMNWGDNAKGAVSADVASSRAISFIDETYIRGAAVIKLVETIKESDVYRITLDIEGDRFDVFTTLDGKIFFPEGFDLEDRAVFERTMGGFVKVDDDLCLDDGKPIIYYFGTSECPFCQWQHPVVVEAMERFKGYVSFKDNTDTDDDLEVFFRYSDGGVPLIVAGCNYFRVGAGGSQGDEESDRDIISAIACKLTGGEPGDVCDGLEEIINEI